MDAETIENNWKTYESLCKRLNDEGLNKLLTDLGDRIVECPNSPKLEQTGCYPGGLIEISLRVASTMRKLNETLDDKLPTSSIIRVGLLHEIGKIGDLETLHFLDQDSDWHRDKLGQMYKYNEEMDKMTYAHRALWLLQYYGVSLSRDEWEAIATSGGYHLEENRFYTATKNKLGRLLCAARLLVL
jgi:hypothetical protein